MPTYQYACAECGHRFEAVQAFTDDSLTECPECHGKLRKVYGSVGVVFKGSGFYRNDSRSDAKVGATASPSATGGSSDKSDSAGAAAKTESAKPAAASPSAASTSSSSSSSSSATGSGGSTSSSAASTSRAAG